MHDISLLLKCTTNFDWKLDKTKKKTTNLISNNQNTLIDLFQIFKNGQHKWGFLYFILFYFYHLFLFFGGWFRIIFRRFFFISLLPQFTIHHQILYPVITVFGLIPSASFVHDNNLHFCEILSILACLFC